MVQRNIGTAEQWNSGTVEQRVQTNSGTLGTEEQRSRGTVAQRNNGTGERWSSRYRELEE